MSTLKTLLHARYAERTCLMDEEDPERFIDHVQGQLLEQAADAAEGQHLVEVGQFGLYRLDLVGAAKAGISPYTVFDAGGATWPYFALFGNRDDLVLNAAVRTALRLPTDLQPCNVLAVDHLQVSMEARLRRVHRAALAWLLGRHGVGCHLAAMRLPMQYEGSGLQPPAADDLARVGLTAFRGTWEQALRRLSVEYSGFGVRVMPRLGLMLHALR